MYFSSNESLEPDDLALLRKVLEEVCAEKNLPLDHPDAATIAHELINWRLFGIRQPEELKSMIKPLIP